MDEIRRDQPGLAIIPARHGSRAAHHLESIEESAIEFGGHAALNIDDARYGGQRFDLAAIFLAAVHGTHHQYRSIGQRGAYAADGFAQLPLVFVREEGGEAALVGAVIQNHQVGMAVAQLAGPMALVEEQGRHRDGCAVQTDAVVDHSGLGLLESDAEHAHGTLAVEFKRGGSGLQIEARESGARAPAHP